MPIGSRFGLAYVRARLRLSDGFCPSATGRPLCDAFFGGCQAGFAPLYAESASNWTHKRDSAPRRAGVYRDARLGIEVASKGAGAGGARL